MLEVNMQKTEGVRKKERGRVSLHNSKLKKILMDKVRKNKVDVKLCKEGFG